MSVPVDWKPERAIQAKIRDMQNIYSRWIENPKGRFRQKLGIQKEKILKRKAMTIWKLNLKGILGPVQKWRLLLSFGLLGYTPTLFWLKGFIPTMFVSSPVILSPFKVTKYLYCDDRATFGPVHVCLNSLTILLSVEFHTYAFMHT